MDDVDLQRSRRALLLIDFINPLNFPQATDLAAPALAAAKAAAKDAALPYMRNILKCDTRPWQQARWYR